MTTVLAPLLIAESAPVAATTGGRRGTLAAALDSVLEIGVALRASRGAASTDAAGLRQQILQQLRTAEQESLAHGYSRTDVRAALFASIVFLDEVVLNTRPMFGNWARRPLQEEVFGEHVGGEAFFTQLDAQLARPDSDDAGDVLEVFQLCLLLGFRGRHGGNDGELAGIATRVARKLERIRGPMMALSPRWSLPAGETIPARIDPLARSLQRAATIAVVSALVLFGVYSLLLRGNGEQWRTLAATLERR